MISGFLLQLKRQWATVGGKIGVNEAEVKVPVICGCG